MRRSPLSARRGSWATSGRLDQLLRLGMNRVSFGAQSFVDAEARAVGRLHTREICLGGGWRGCARRACKEINVDLIAGLPRQTRASWRESVEVVGAGPSACERVHAGGG